MLEKEVIKTTLRHAKSLGIPWIRMVFRPGVQVGWPDILFLIPGGRPLFIEFKATGKLYNTSAHQDRKLEELEELGYDACVIDCPDEANKALTHALEAAQLSSKGDQVP